MPHAQVKNRIGKMYCFFYLGKKAENKELSNIPNNTRSNRRDPIFKCPICNSGKSSLGHLRVHIGNAHYKEEVRKLINKDTLGCNLCQKTFKVMQHTVILFISGQICISGEFKAAVVAYN